MTALLRSGKFLRLVSGFARSGPASTQNTNHNGGNHEDTGQLPSFASLDSSGGHAPFQAWSIQHLQNALPLLSGCSEKETDRSQERRRSDPLLDFLVDKQKIEDIIKEEVKEESPSKKKVGLNAIKEVEQEPVTTTSEPPKKHAAVIIEDVKVEEDKDVQIATTCTQTETVTTLNEVQTVVQAQEECNPVPITATEEVWPDNYVPMVQVQEQEVHNWYPLPVVCQMFRAQGRLIDLENLLWGSVGIRPEDRKCIYYWTLQAYADVGLFQNAMDLTNRLESEGLATDFPEYHALMHSFATACYATHNNAFQDTSNATNGSSSKDSSSYPSTPASEAEEQMSLQALYHRQLKKGLTNKNAKESLECYLELEKTGKELNVTESSALIELLVKEDLCNEATAIADKMLARETYPMPKIFRFLLNRLASGGQVESMNKLGSYLTPRVKKEVSFDNRLCNAYLAAGRGGDYLDMLKRELDNALTTDSLDEEKLQGLKDKFPRGGAMGLLESNPHLVDSYTDLALRFVSLGYVAPVNVLWTYHFISGRHDLAEPLWQRYVKSCPQIMFQKVCQTARSRASVDLAEGLVDLLEDAAVTNGARGIAYSCLLDVLAQTKEYERGLQALETGLRSGIRIDDINRTALKRMKEGLDNLGQDFPYEIPRKTNGTSSSCGEDSVRSCTPALE